MTPTDILTLAARYTAYRDTELCIRGDANVIAFAEAVADYRVAELLAKLDKAELLAWPKIEGQR